jgi:hypothetical protein
MAADFWLLCMLSQPYVMCLFICLFVAGHTGRWSQSIIWAFRANGSQKIAAFVSRSWLLTTQTQKEMFRDHPQPQIATPAQS